MRKAIIFIIFLFIPFQNIYSQRALTDIGIGFGPNLLVGETKLTRSIISPNVGIYGIYQYSPLLSFKLQAGYGEFGIERNSIKDKTKFIPVELTGLLTFSNGSSIIPFLQFGLGAMNFSQNNSPRYFDGIFIGGGGFSAQISDNFSFMISADLRYTTSDQFNNVFSGINDGYFNFQTGISYNLKPTVFQRKSKLERKDIIALNKTQPVDDNVLERVALRSKLNNLETAISLRNEQIRQIQSQLQNRDERIKNIEKQITELSTRKTTQTELVQQVQSPQKAERNITSVNLTDKEIKQKYNQAVASFNSRNYQTTITELKLLSNNFPTHLLASNFVYWIGECYNAQGKYSDAVKSFEEVLKFNKSSKLDDALIMCGISYIKLGNPAKANEKLQELVSKYPSSEYYGKARRLIQSIQNSIIS